MYIGARGALTTPRKSLRNGSTSPTLTRGDGGERERRAKVDEKSFGASFAVAVLIICCQLVLPAGTLGAVTALVDFESGPPIGTPVNDEYAAAASVFWQRSDPGFRPYRRTAGVATRSGTVAADISPEHCYPGEEDNAGACEFVTPSTFARLTRFASAVTLYAGLFTPANDSVSARLTAYNAAGTEVGTSTAPIGVGITTPITVTSPAADIDRFTLVAEGPGAVGAALGFDDLTIQFPGNPPSPPPPACPDTTIDSPHEDRVTSAAELDARLRSDFTGRVIVPRDVEWEMKDCDGNLLRDIPVHSDVQLIGERGELGSRPLLYTRDDPRYSGESLFKVTGNEVLIEGLHLRGYRLPADHAIRPAVYLHAITVNENFDDQKVVGRHVYITDNEFEQWSGGCVNLVGSHSVPIEKWDYGWVRPDRSYAYLVRIEANYMHHNLQDGGGYGVTIGGDAWGYVIGNVFDFNRHAVAAGGEAYSGYIARFNFVLQGGVKQKNYWNQHFDVHGTGPEQYGGYAGEYFEIAYNTIRGDQKYGRLGVHVKTRPAFMLRGRPGNPRDHRTGVVNGAYFHDNVAVHESLDAAVSLKMDKDDTGYGEDQEAFNFHASGNHFGTDYSTEVATGDFDGDGRTDVFLANGTGWFFSRAGIRPWEFLHASNKRTYQLAFADIDNDHVTDVLYRDSKGNLGYLKSGRFDLVPLTHTPAPIKELRFGDFDGDGLTDIFYTRKREWHVWYGSARAWRQVGGSVTPISEMLFGEFDDVRGTDIAAVRNNQWSYSSGATERWARLNGKRTDSFKGAVAADFDGNGFADIAYIEGKKWYLSRDGRSPLAVVRTDNAPTAAPLLIGTFVSVDGTYRGAQVVKWVDNTDPVRPNQAHDPFGLWLAIWRGLGTGDGFSRLSAQNMR